MVITVRIPKELKEKAKYYNINISKTLREALAREIRQKELEHIRSLQRRAKEILGKIRKEKIVRAVRETRDEF